MNPLTRRRTRGREDAGQPAVRGGACWVGHRLVGRLGIGYAVPQPILGDSILSKGSIDSSSSCLQISAMHLQLQYMYFSYEHLGNMIIIDVVINDCSHSDQNSTLLKDAVQGEEGG